MMVRLAKAVAVLLLASVLGFRAVADAQTAEEVVKAQFVYRFTSFAGWPADAFASAEAPIILCVVGAEHFADTLTRATADQRVGGRAFEVRRVRANEARLCHVVYASGLSTADALRAVRGAPVLTITDATSGAGEVRGMIHFAIVENRVRFYVDDAAAAEAHLTIDSRLLGLALSVRRRAGA
jgi:YfiR/HmsC-like